MGRCWLYTVSFICLLSACSPRHEDDETPNSTTPPATISSQNPTGPSGPKEVVSQGFSYTVNDPIALTPEQISRFFDKRLGIRFGHTRKDGSFVDELAKNIVLGAIDFIETTERDTTPGVQAMLTIRELAFSAAIQIVEKADKGEDALQVFSLADIRHDLPVANLADIPAEQQQQALEGEQRWEAQMRALYRTILGREALDEEIAYHRQLFLTVLEEQQHFPPPAWVVSTYVLLTSMEFWSR